MMTLQAIIAHALQTGVLTSHREEAINTLLVSTRPSLVDLEALDRLLDAIDAGSVLILE